MNTLFASPDVVAPDEVLHVDLGGYEGPLDLLLDLARRQKVDLAALSVLALAEQYLAFIETVRDRRLEIAADYLVMAAWLTYLKSRLMVPSAPRDDDEPTGEMLAEMLQLRLLRLEIIRVAASRLMSRQRLGVEVHARGMPDEIVVRRRSAWSATLFDLLRAYGAQRGRQANSSYAPVHRTVWSLQQARDILQRLIGDSAEWVPMDTYLASFFSGKQSASVRASSFASSLELVRQGRIEIRQTDTFGPLLMRRRQTPHS
jgi:segregation and condensation protein A